MNAPPLFPGVQPVDESIRTTGNIAAFLFDDFSLWVEQDKRGESLDMVLLLQLFILFYDLGRQRFPLWKINLHKNEVFIGILLEVGLIKGFLFQLHAPPAPIATGKVEQHILVLLGASSQSGFVIITPSACECGHDCYKE